MKLSHLMKSLAITGALALMGQNSIAATNTGSLSVTATVIPTCAITATTLSFGTNLPTNITADINSSTTISVNCPSGTPYKVALGLGIGSGASKTSGRKMMSGANSLLYNLYTDSGFTNAWSDTIPAQADATIASGTGTGLSQVVSVFGKILKNQTVAPGAYSDTVVITVDY